MTNNSPQVICLGEILMDMISPDRGITLAQVTRWLPAPGGAPANTAVGLARLGIRSGFLGGIGSDQFGMALRALLQKEGVDVTGSAVIPGTQTRMAWVITKPDGDRELAEFTQFGCADAEFGFDHLSVPIFVSPHVLHFGSISQIGLRSGAATTTAIQRALAAGSLISYDPNVRLALWQDADTCRSTILETLPQAHIVKINEGELHFLCQDDITPSALLSGQLRSAHDIPLLLVTLDSRGALLVHEAGTVLEVPGYSVQLVEATGAGDAFNAGLLCGLVGHLELPANRGLARHQVLRALERDDLLALVLLANAVGALACTKTGAIPAMPTMQEVEQFLST